MTKLSTNCGMPMSTSCSSAKCSHALTGKRSLTYDECIQLLNGLQSNAKTLSRIRSLSANSRKEMNKKSLSEMREYWKVICEGYDYNAMKLKSENSVKSNDTCNSPDNLEYHKNPENIHVRSFENEYINSKNQSLDIIHIAGTKGKGSTCAFVESILRYYNQNYRNESEEPDSLDANGNRWIKPRTRFKTGMFTSPHLIHVRERIRIDGEPISQEKFAKSFSEIYWLLRQEFSISDRMMPNIEGKLGGGGFFEKQNSQPKDNVELSNSPQKSKTAMPTYFRFLTLLALHIFRKEKTSPTIMEVGIGGEYDSTNFMGTVHDDFPDMQLEERLNGQPFKPSILYPLVCGITALGHDHQDILGSELDEIAWHKAGIMREGVDCVLASSNSPKAGNQQPDQIKRKQKALQVIEQRAKERKARLIQMKSGDDGAVVVVNANEQQAQTVLSHYPTPHSFTPTPISDLKLGLNGEHQKENAQLANWISWIWICKLKNPKQVRNEQIHKSIRKGLETAWWPGRAQIVKLKNDKCKVYLDGAHTPESLQACMRWFNQEISQTNQSPKYFLIFNCTANRDARVLIQTILDGNCDGRKFEKVFFACSSTGSGGSKKMIEIWRELEDGALASSLRRVESIGQALQEATEASPAAILVTGSVHLVGGALDWLVGRAGRQRVE